MMEMQVSDKELPKCALTKVKALSSTSTSRFKLGAIILKKKKIIGRGINSKKTSPVFGSGKYQCYHAEGKALHNCITNGQDPKGAILIVHRVNDNVSRPCSCCQKMLKKYGIKKVYYYNEQRQLVSTWP